LIVLTVAKGFFQRNSFQKEVTHLLHCVEGSDILKQLISVGVTAVIMQKELLNSGAYLEGGRTGAPPPKLSKGIMHSRKNH